MTFIERMKLEHPEKIPYYPNDTIDYNHSKLGCPYEHGYEKTSQCWEMTCAQCWTREMPGTEKTENDICKGEINMNKPTVEFTVNKASLEPRSSEELMAEAGALAEQARVPKVKEDYEKSARELKMVYDAFIDAGFSKEEAWKIFMTLAKKGIGDN